MKAGQETMAEKKQASMVVISVILCTFNRSDMLKGCLESLCQQTLEKNKYEIIVVDNNSSDDTNQVVEAYRDRGNIRYCVEKQPGLSHARNRGLEEAQGIYVAYIDDDARAAPDWLDVACSLFESVQGRIDCLGGPCHPFYTSSKPNWFKDQYEVRGYEGGPRYLKNNESIAGSNMIWVKETLNEIGGFSVNHGVIGNQLRLGEETKALEKLRLLNHQARLYYSPHLIIYHWVPDFKMTVLYRLKRKFAEGQYEATRIVSEGTIGRLASIGKLLMYIAKASFRFFLKVKYYPCWQSWIVEGGGHIARKSGELFGLAGIYLRIKQA